MVDPKKVIREKIDALLLDFNIEVSYSVNHAQNPNFGDYSSNVALVLFNYVKEKYENPIVLAEEIVSKLDVSELFSDIKVEKGFINFWLKEVFLKDKLKEIIEKKKDFGVSNIGKGKKARVEFVSANPTGPLHIGNARGGPIGDVLANVLAKAGYDVTREYLHNDVGGQVKAMGATIKAICQGGTLTGDLTGEQYKGEYTKELAEKLKDKIKGLSDEETGKLAVDMLFAEIMDDLTKMGIKYDLIVKESELRKKADRAISELKKKGVLQEKEGALWFAPNDEFLKDRETVVVKSDGEYTYFTSDIVYHKEKFESGADLIIDIFGSNHSGHVPRLKAVVRAFGFNPEKLMFILYQFVRVKRGDEIVKMSKRAGNFVTAREVLDEVGSDAFRFFLLTTRPETHMDFDIALAKEKKSDNPVYYVQYAHARISSILAKDEAKIASEVKFDLLEKEEEFALIRHLIKLPELIDDLAGNFEVHRLTAFAITTADFFHKFYEKHKVLSNDQELTKARLGLIMATQIVLQNTLSLLGISAPSKM